MNVYLKKALLLLLSALMLPIVSCAKQEEYLNNVSCEELMKQVEERIPTDLGYTSFGTDQILYYFENQASYDDVCLRYSTRSENINEIGIFHSPNESAQEELEDKIEEYLEQMWEEQRAFIASYAPEELPKLEHAEIESFGNYTVYAILSDEDQKTVFRILEEHLSAPS